MVCVCIPSITSYIDRPCCGGQAVITWVIIKDTCRHVTDGRATELLFWIREGPMLSSKSTHLVLHHTFQHEHESQRLTQSCLQEFEHFIIHRLQVWLLLGTHVHNWMDIEGTRY